MTAAEARANGIDKIRLPYWEPSSHVRMERSGDGWAIWARLFGVGAPPEGHPIPLFQLDRFLMDEGPACDEWEAYEKL